MKKYQINSVQVLIQTPKASNEAIRQQHELQFLENVLGTIKQELSGFKEVR